MREKPIDNRPVADGCIVFRQAMILVPTQNSRGAWKLESCPLANSITCYVAQDYQRITANGSCWRMRETW